jgi:hypothetical protein
MTLFLILVVISTAVAIVYAQTGWKMTDRFYGLLRVHFIIAFFEWFLCVGFRYEIILIDQTQASEITETIQSQADQLVN